MPSPHKRTRSGTSANGLPNNLNASGSGSENDENDEIPSPTPVVPRTRRQVQATMTMTPPPTRPRPNGLARANSLMFTPSTRRTNNSSHGATPFTLSPSTPSLGGTGMLLRTQSTPSSIGLGTPSFMKSPSVSGGSAGRGKGEDDYFSLGPRRPGQGKENIPPKKDEEMGSRKRLRVSSRSGGRGRSGSVSSLRSETPSTSGRPSLGHTSSLSRIASRATSPTPSTCSNTTRSFDSVSIATSSVDPLDVISVAGDGDTDTEDIDQTPTKPKTRAQFSKGLYTPPPSSPTVDDTTKRIELIRVQSSLSSDDETKSSNPYKYLKSFLRLSTSGDELDKVIIGRASEKETLRTYLGNKEREVGMYVSGPPGTGKTALVTALGREVMGRGWGMVEIGCMGLKIGDIWRRLGEELRCGKTEAGVVDHIEGLNGDLIIILDEIDSLLPPSGQASPATSHLLSKLFALPLASTSTRSIKLVAISNTLDLTIRARLSLPDNLVPQVLPFKAYGAMEMGEIMLSRIAAAAVNRLDTETVKVDAKAVELLTRKVEATNGDLRNCLGCLTSAVSLAEVEWTKKAATVLVKVALPHTIKAFNSHTQQLKAAAGSGNGTQSATGKKVRSVPLQGKMVLVSILVYLARSRAGLPGCPTTTPIGTPSKSSEALNTSNLFTTYTTLLSHHTSPFPPSHESDYRDLLSNLEVLGLVKLTTSTASRKYGPKVDLCVRDEELREALGVGKEGGGLADEEVKRIYERESIKIQAAVNKAERAALNSLGEEL